MPQSGPAPVEPRTSATAFRGVRSVISSETSPRALGFRLGRALQLPAARGALIERHAGGAERVTEVALPIQRASCVADEAGRHGGAANVDRTPVAQTLYERDELVD
jgi:hypothetical protein